MSKFLSLLENLEIQRMMTVRRLAHEITNAPEQLRNKYRISKRDIKERVQAAIEMPLFQDVIERDLELINNKLKRK